MIGYPHNFLYGEATRQGCPLSPSLFVLALEPLAILIRESPLVMGLRVSSLEEKIYLYAKGALVHLQDASSSLTAALDLFNMFGRFSGVCINWSKSFILPLDPPARLDVADIPLVWVDQFRYLGVQIQWDVASFFDLNLTPLFSQLRLKFTSWASLPLNLMGNINLLKMLFLPKFINFFWNCPICIRNYFFQGH